MLTIFTHIVILPEIVQNAPASDHSGYLTGLVIAIFILGYLVYSLLKPEKF